MPTECSRDLFGFAAVEGRRVEAAFDGGAISSNAGALLLGSTERAVRLVERFAGCFRDSRRAESVEHQVCPERGGRSRRRCAVLLRARR